MVVVRSPLRISLGGGGTDLPSYYQQFGGYFLSAAIDKFVSVTLSQSADGHYVIKHSMIETASTIDALKHPIAKTILKKYALNFPVIVSSHSDVFAGTGLGSSGAYTAALLKAVSIYCKCAIEDKMQLAEAACKIEMQDLQLPVGKQDPYVSIYGGVNSYAVAANGGVMVKPLGLSQEALCLLENNLCLFYTGQTRASSILLRDQDEKSKSQNKIMLDNLHYTKELGFRIHEELIREDFYKFAVLMDEHWQHKQQRTNGMSNPQINELYDYGKKNGAIGGKLIGAGGGGFLMFYTESRKQLENAMAEKGLSVMPFRFDFEGTKQLV